MCTYFRVFDLVEMLIALYSTSTSTIQLSQVAVTGEKGKKGGGEKSLENTLTRASCHK